MTNLSKVKEGCKNCRWQNYPCDPIIKKLQGLDCPDYERTPNKNLYTCFKCTDNKTCEFAYDGYNLKGDCLAIK